MITQHPNIDDVRELYDSILYLVEIGAVYALPARDPLDPIIRAARHCSNEDLESAIPLHRLRRIYREAERAFLAREN